MAARTVRVVRRGERLVGWAGQIHHSSAGRVCRRMLRSVRWEVAQKMHWLGPRCADTGEMDDADTHTHLGAGAGGDL